MLPYFNNNRNAVGIGDQWVASSTSGVVPLANTFRTNASSLSGTQALYIHKTSLNNINKQNFLTNYGSGDRISISQSENPSNYGIYDIKELADFRDYVALAVTPIASSGNLSSSRYSISFEKRSLYAGEWQAGSVTGVVPGFIIDIPKMRNISGYLFKDTNKVSPTMADGESIALMVNPLTGADLTPTTPVYLRYVNGTWCMSCDPNTGGYGAFHGIPLTPTVPFSWGVGASFQQVSGDYSIALSLNGGTHQLGYWNTDKVEMYNYSSIIGTSGSIKTTALQSVFGAYSSNTSGAFVRQNGRDIFRGTSTTNSGAGINLGASYSGGGGQSAAISRALILTSGNISPGETRKTENWLVGGRDKHELDNYIWVGFDGQNENLAIHSSSDIENWKLAANAYRPANIAFGSHTTHSVRDLTHFYWNSNHYFAHNWQGLVFGGSPFATGVSFSIGKFPASSNTK